MTTPRNGALNEYTLETTLPFLAQNNVFIVPVEFVVDVTLEETSVIVYLLVYSSSSET